MYELDSRVLLDFVLAPLFLSCLTFGGTGFQIL